MSDRDLPGTRPSRREVLRRAGAGFGSMAMAALLADEASAATLGNPLSPRPPHFPGRARRVIFLFMPGGPSQVDTFDPKPRLTADHGKPSPEALPGRAEEAARLPLAVPPAGRVGARGERALPARRVVHRPALRDPLDGGGRRQPSRRLPPDEHRRAGGHASQPGRLGDVRAGHREPGPARFRRDRPRSADRRGPAVRRRLPAGRRTRGRSSPTCATRSAT